MLSRNAATHRNYAKRWISHGEFPKGHESDWGTWRDKLSRTGEAVVAGHLTENDFERSMDLLPSVHGSF